MPNTSQKLENKTCSDCKETKPTSEFYPRGSGFYSMCKACKRSQRRRMYQETSATNINNLIHRFIKTADIIFEHELDQLTDVSEMLERKIKSWQDRKATTVQ